MIQPLEVPQLIFCFTENRPETLVMLYQSEYVLKEMMDTKKTYVIWLAPNVDPELYLKMKQKCKENEIVLIHFLKVQEMKEFLYEDARLPETILIVYQSGMFNKIQGLLRKEQIKFVIEDQTFPVPQLPNLNPLSNSSTLPQHYIHDTVQDHQTLLFKIEAYGRPEAKYKQLMNFVPLSNQIWKSNVLVRTIFAMINQKIDANTRKQIVERMRQLVGRADPDINVEQLFCELSKGPLSTQRAISWYTSSKGIYKIVNNILRSAEHPAQIFYIQPFVKDVFFAILNIEKKKKKKESFVCFRGGLLSTHEVKKLESSVGEAIKNLSFLSTSLEEETAELFMKNARFQIIVDDKERAEGYDYGFTEIKQFSQYYSQQEIVFNPLSSFKVLQIKQIKHEKEESKYYIRLQYGIISRIMAKPEPQLTQKERYLYYIGQQWRQEAEKIQLQGEVLIANKENLSMSCEYWCKYVEIADRLEDRYFGLTNYGSSKDNKGQYREAMQLYEQGMAALNESYQNQCKRLQKLKLSSNMIKIQEQQRQIKQKYTQCKVNILLLMAQLNKKESKFKESIQLYLNCISIQKDRPSCLNDLLFIYFSIGQLSEAESIFERIQEKGWENNLVTWSSMGIILQSQRKFQQAYKIFEKCSKFQRNVLGQNHKDYLSSLSSMGCVSHQMQNLEHAKQIFQTCINIAKRFLPESHPDYVGSLNNLSNILHLMGKRKEAFQLQQKCLNLRYKYRGENHPDYLLSLNNMAVMLQEAGRLSEALSIQKFSLKIIGRVLGKFHPNYLTLLNNMALFLKEMGKLKESLQLFKECLRKNEEIFGERHQNYLHALNNFIGLLQQMGQINQALELQQKYTRVRLQINGENHLDYAASLNSMAITLSMAGKLEKALQLFLRCHQIFRKISGVKNLNYLISFQNVAMVYLKMGMPAEALQVQMQCLLASRSCKEPRNPLYCKFYLFYIGVYLTEGNYEKALIQITNKSMVPLIEDLFDLQGYFELKIKLYQSLSLYKKAAIEQKYWNRTQVPQKQAKARKKLSQLTTEYRVKKSKICHPLNFLNFQSIC